MAPLRQSGDEDALEEHFDFVLNRFRLERRSVITAALLARIKGLNRISSSIVDGTVGWAFRRVFWNGGLTSLAISSFIAQSSSYFRPLKFVLQVAILRIVHQSELEIRHCELVRAIYPLKTAMIKRDPNLDMQHMEARGTHCRQRQL